MRRAVNPTVLSNTAVGAIEPAGLAPPPATEVTVIEGVAQQGVPLHVIDYICEPRGSGDEEDNNLEVNTSSLGKRKNFQETSALNKLMTKKQWEKEQSRLIGAHFPTSVRLEAFEGKPRERGQGSNKRNWKRGSCKLCGKHLPNICENCGVYLCIKNDQNQMNCWKKFHTRATFSEPDDSPEAVAIEGLEAERKQGQSAEDSDGSDN